MAIDNIALINSVLTPKGIKLIYGLLKQNIEGYYLQYQYNIPSNLDQEIELYTIYIVHKETKAGRGMIEVKNKANEIVKYLIEGFTTTKPITRWISEENGFHIMLIDFEIQD